MSDQKATNYAVAITSVSDYDDLGCTKTVTVSWEKPDKSDQAKLRLFCNCSQHATRPDHELDYYDTPTTSASGTYSFHLNHSALNETDKTIYVRIDNNGEEKNRDSRIHLYAQCPVSPHTGQGINGSPRKRAAKKSKRNAKKATCEAIEIDAPDHEIIHLTRGRNKILKGCYNPAIGRKLMIFAYRFPNAQVLLLAKEVNMLPRRRWIVKLPRALWDTITPQVRFAFVDRNGILGNAFSFATTVS